VKEKFFMAGDTAVLEPAGKQSFNPTSAQRHTTASSRNGIIHPKLATRDTANDPSSHWYLWHMTQVMQLLICGAEFCSAWMAIRKLMPAFSNYYPCIPILE
jgi:hypothetical protein